MRTQKIEVVMNISDIKVVEKVMTQALSELINDKINKFPIEYRKEVCEQILKVGKNNLVNDNK